MNTAQEIILRWYFGTCELDIDEIDIFLAALGRGYSLGQEDALQLMGQYMRQSVTRSKGSEFEEIIEQLYRLSSHYEKIERSEKIVEGLLKLKKIAENERAGPLNERIKRVKVASVLSEIEKEIAILE